MVSAFPVPDNVASAESPVPALTARVALKTPGTVGANTTSMVQLAPPARTVPPHVSDAT
jgi:hypothetical protein